MQPPKHYNRPNEVYRSVAHLSRSINTQVKGIAVLHAGRVQHDANTSAQRLGWDVRAELRLHDAVRAVGAGDTAPNHAALGARLVGLGNLKAATVRQSKLDAGPLNS
jgi:hypothetical protein